MVRVRDSAYLLQQRGNDSISDGGSKMVVGAVKIQRRTVTTLL